MDDTLDSFFTEEEWAKLLEADPSLKVFQSANWQDPTTFASTIPGQSTTLTSSSTEDAKPRELNWRDIQAKTWEKYRGFGPINASVNSKADYITGDGFSIYSDNLDIDRFLFDLIYSRRNRLYAAINGWMIRMQAEGELFLLLVFDEEGRATVRVLEPSRIGVGSSDEGLIVDPDDATQTLFYSYNGIRGKELIPDVNIMFDPSLLDKAEAVPGCDMKFTERSQDPRPRFKRIGGYRRFVLHWKNLTGIHEYLRDTSHLRTILEAVSLYWNAIKWGLDHKKAQCAYTNEFYWNDSPTGRIAWQIWKKMSQEEKDKTGLTKPLTPGSKVFLPPGVRLAVHAPQLTKLSGENQDLLNVAGAGARSPQDLFQGSSQGQTFASIRSTRPPLVQEIRSIGSKLAGFLQYEFLRACFHAKSRLGGFPERFEKEIAATIKDGVPTFKTIEVEPVELIKIVLPTVSFEEFPERKANALLGSKHAGLASIGLSDDYIAKEMGVDDLSRQKRLRLEEEAAYGKRQQVDPDLAAEEEFIRRGVEERG